MWICDNESKNKLIQAIQGAHIACDLFLQF